MHGAILSYLVNNSFKVLRISENENSTNELERYSWWIVDNFEPTISKGVESIDFNYVKGIDVTDHLNTNRYQDNEMNFLTSFNNHLAAQKRKSMKFSSAFKWKYYYV